jgi:hypothetical protein
LSAGIFTILVMARCDRFPKKINNSFNSSPDAGVFAFDSNKEMLGVQCSVRVSVKTYSLSI